MLTIEHWEVEGWAPAIHGMRNPMNSWDKADSHFVGSYDELENDEFLIGPNDKDLMKRLASAGKDHAKYRRMIVVYADLIAPLYWWKEYDTYKVGTVANSCSTMHKIQAKEFTLDDFSHEHLDDHEDCVEDDDGCLYTSLGILKLKIDALNYWRNRYNETKDKHAWYQMIQLLDSSYNQRRTVMLNYEVLANIYPARKAHKLDEWHTFCDWIRNLPESWIITGEEKDD